jgi:imidazolonepropionase-like amidohydrolase
VSTARRQASANRSSGGTAAKNPRWKPSSARLIGRTRTVTVGVTTVFDIAGNPFLAQQKAALAAGQLLGPRLFGVRAVRAGVTIAMGTDAGNAGTPHGATVLRELQLLHEAGMTPMQVLVAATRNAALVIGQGDRLGTLEAGKLADLIVVDGDPLHDLARIADLVLVVKNGRAIDPRTIAFD